MVPPLRFADYRSSAPIEAARPVDVSPAPSRATSPDPQRPPTSDLPEGP